MKKMLTKEIKKYSMILVLTAILTMAIVVPAVKADAIHKGTVSITPTEVTCDTPDAYHLFCVKITNDPTSTQSFSSAKIKIPDGWTGTTVAYLAIATGWDSPTTVGGLWTDSSNSTHIRVAGTGGGGSTSGTNVEPGQTLYIFFTSTAPHNLHYGESATYDWIVTAYLGGDFTSSTLEGVTYQAVTVTVICPICEPIGGGARAFVFMGAPVKESPPAGTYPADWIDGTAAAIIMGMITSPSFSFDTNSTAINQAADLTNGGDLQGGPPGSGVPDGSLVITSGGPLVNAPVRYYETHSGTENTPMYFGSHVVGFTVYYDLYWGATGTYGTPDALIPNTEVDFSTLVDTDVFVIQIFHDAAGNQVIMAYGYTGLGTFASTLYFKFEMYSNVLGKTLTDGYQIVRWTDAPSGPGHNHLPDVPSVDSYFAIWSSYPP
jgi:hypothetical protein